ncbi:hypothetical protein BZA05DRAFT_459306 [Tricharina praecox]|uniref:uncharacterized protein n=1 Tax=Tricharina praecox TaxID=43433 RepID=UPI00221E3A55|nr:uncharacterized protein BZA05DRAFT_459306 [Tricharina praecox]KAI5844821.1 hypothetical protein BZA05DRAFT_459306 [Tricharina praecox]
MADAARLRFCLKETALIATLYVSLSLMAFFINRLKFVSNPSKSSATIGRVLIVLAAVAFGAVAVLLQLRIVFVARNRAKQLWIEEQHAAARIRVALREAEGFRTPEPGIDGGADGSDDEAEGATQGRNEERHAREREEDSGTQFGEGAGDIELQDWVRIDRSDSQDRDGTNSLGRASSSEDMPSEEEQREAARIAVLEERIGRILFGNDHHAGRWHGSARRVEQHPHRSPVRGESSNTGAAHEGRRRFFAGKTDHIAMAPPDIDSVRDVGTGGGWCRRGAEREMATRLAHYLG